MPCLLTIRTTTKLVFLCVSLALIVWFAGRAPLFAGDRWDYLYPLQAWFNHASPNLYPEDVTSCTPLLKANSIDNLSSEILEKPPVTVGICRAKGYTFCFHFWLYPLFCLPAKYLLWSLGANELAAFTTTNMALFALALYAIFFHYPAPIGRRLALAGLAGLSPVIWYLPWTSPEAFTWCFVVIALVSLSGKHYVLASICASLGAMQNPPVLFLAGYSALLSWQERDIRLAVFCVSGAALSFIPSLFYYSFFGHPNLIVAWGGADTRLITFERTWSFLTDLNQGMLPYVPLLLVLGCFAVGRIVWMRSLAGCGAVIVLFLMILACEPSVNWNSGATGMMRYGVWIVPVVAWLTTEYASFARPVAIMAVAAVAIQGTIVFRHDGNEDYLEQTRLARFVLSRFPILYDPEPEIFYERQLRGEELINTARLPLPFLYNGRVTKLLVDAESLERLPARFAVDATYFQEITTKYRGRQGLFYLTPPKEKVKLFPSSTIEAFQASIKLALAEMPQRVCSPHLPVKLTIANEGKCTFFGEESAAVTPVRIAYFLSEVGKGGATRGVWFPGRRSAPS